MYRFIIVALTVFTVASCNRFPHNGLQIAGMLPLEGDCTLDPGTDVRQTLGVWDIQAPFGTNPRVTHFGVSPLLENYIISRSTDIQAEQNNLQVTNLEITLQTPDGVNLVLPEALPNPYSVTASASLPVAEDGSFSSGAAFTIAIPPSYRQTVADAVFAAGFDQLIINMRAIGTTMGGFTQKSESFLWPVTLCDGCFDICPTQQDANDLTELELAALLASCLPGQDGYRYCQFTPELPPAAP
jgi:hypothetical protein